MECMQEARFIFDTYAGLLFEFAKEAIHGNTRRHVLAEIGME